MYVKIFLKELSRPIFCLILSFKKVTVELCSIQNFANNWIQTAGIRLQKQPTEPHNHCPCMIRFLYQNFILDFWKADI